MEADHSAEVYKRLLRKLSWMSSVLGEVDEWAESRPPAKRLELPDLRGCKRVSLENLDAHRAREDG